MYFIKHAFYYCFAGENRTISVFQGFEIQEDIAIRDPDVVESVHQLPEGLRQRFVPIGNGLGQPACDISNIISQFKGIVIHFKWGFCF